MKNKFLSKAVPRGTRTIWRYLGALFLLFTFAIGNVWAEEVKLVSVGTTATQSSPDFFDNKTYKSADESYSVNLSTSGTSKSQGGSYDSKKDYYYALGSACDMSGTPSNYFKVSATGCKISKIVVRMHDNSTSQACFPAMGCVDGLPNTSTKSSKNGRVADVIIDNQTPSSYGSVKRFDNASTLTYTFSTNVSEVYLSKQIKKVGLASAAAWSDYPSSSAQSVCVYGIDVYVVPITAPTNYTVTLNPNGGSYASTPEGWTAGSGVFTKSVTSGTALAIPEPSRNNYDFAGWKSGLVDVALSNGKLTVSKDTTLTAQWVDHVAKYTVKYMDGTTLLGTEEVNVTEHPAGLAENPKKDCYTFAAWSPALNTVSGEENDVVEVSATWTPNYAFGAYSFVNVATVGTAPNKLTMTDGTAVNVAAGSRVDNFYFSAMAIKYESGASDALTDYKGWKINTKDATIKFLVENNSQVKVAIGRDNTAAVSYTALNGTAMNNVNQEKSTEVTYSVKAGTMFTISMTTGSTITLKRITITPLYKATYSDEMDLVDGEDNNVTEVTLPTPSQTTKEGKNFTGWKANQIVTVDNVAVAANTLIASGKTAVLGANTTFTAQWVTPSNFDVKFFQGYGDPDVQIGDKQTISTGNFAVAPADPVREGYAFLGWSYDATVAHIVTVGEYAITAATNFTAMWIQQFTVTFDGAGGKVVDNGATVSAPDAPTQAGKVFQGWYNGESKYDFSAAVTAALALTSKWADADPNHYVYAYDDAIRFDGVAYHTPEGKATDPDNDEATLNLPNSLTLFSGEEGITSIEATKAVYDYKKAANTKHVTAYLKLKKSSDDANSKLIFTIATGYTAVLKVKMGGYSKTPTVTLKKGDEAVTGSPAAVSGTATGKDYAEITYNLVAGTYEMTTADQTLYFSNIDLEATVIPAKVVTYKAGEGTGDDVVDNDATEVLGCPNTFTAPEGKIFNGWKDGDDNDVEVGAVVNANMTLTAQWINHYAVTFNMKDHGSAIAAQDIKHGEKATKPAAPVAIGYDFGGWFTDEDCTEGNEFDFNTAITAATPLYAKWTAFTGCVELWPAKTGTAPAVDDVINMQDGSNGATMTVLNLGEGSLTYTNAGLAFASKSGPKVGLVLGNDMKEGTKIQLTLVAGGDKTRGLNLHKANGDKINDFTCWVDGANPATNGAEETFTYIVQMGDGLEGTNEFQLSRNNTVYLKALKISNCDDPIIYHNLTSTVNIAGKGTVTLGATSVREGYTTTAEYSNIDEAYEFVNWTVSGEGASIVDATANPATITMGTEDAVVTLNLQLKPVYYTVTYMDGTTQMGTEQVIENGNPTAAGIATAKKGYTFLGWSEDGDAVVNLENITITAAKTLYAKYEAILCPTSGTVFSMAITDPEDTEYNENNDFGLEIGATYVGGKAYSGSKSSTKRIGYIDANGEYAFANNGDVTVKIDMDCALQEGDVLSFTTSTTRELKIQKVAGTDLYTTSGKTFTIPAESPLIGEYVFYLQRGNSQSTFKTFEVYRPAVLTGVTLADAVVTVDGKVTPQMTLTPAPDAYISSQVWSIVGEGAGTIATINTENGEVTGKAIGSVTVKVVLNNTFESTCTVNVIDSYTQVDVTGTSEWNFAGGKAASSKISFDSNNEEYLLANISGVNNTSDFNSRALLVKGKYVSNSQLQAQTIRFNTTVPGKLTIRFACTSDKGSGNERELYVNGVATGSETSNGEVTYVQVVPAGEVSIKALYDKESVLTEDIMNYKYIKFTAASELDPEEAEASTLGGYERDVTEGRYGTICLPNGGVMVGATIYTLAYYGETSQKIFFDEVLNGTMEAGKPYLFLPNEGIDRIGVFYTDAAGAEAKTVNGFVGYIGASEDPEDAHQVPAGDGNYIVQNNQYREIQAGATAYILSHRAYIHFAGINTSEPAKAPGARRIGISGAPQVVTGMDALKTAEAPVKVLINGQLYILRGEKMYDATGRLVK